MSENTKKSMNDFSFTQNRELSWLKFNNRVLEEAMDESVPVIERLKFISIFTSNLDEFFMVRVGSLFDLAQITPDDKDNKTGDSPIDQLRKIFATVPALIAKRDNTYKDVCHILDEFGISDVTDDELTEDESKIVNNYFEQLINPVLSPQIIDPHHPFPHLKNKTLYIAATLQGKKDKVSLGHNTCA